MPFPECPRVKYEINPLVEVLCQLVFSAPYSTSEGFTNESMPSLHERVKSKFPLFTINKAVHIDVNAEEEKTTKRETSVFEFLTIDQNYRISLTSESVTITTSRYTCWEDFHSLFYYFIEAGLFSVHGEKTIQRIGLRYKDVIERTKLNLTNIGWDELINPALSFPFSKSNILSNKIKGASSSLLISLDDAGSQLSFSYGLVLNNVTNETAFLIDGDFISTGTFEYGNVKANLNSFNVKARNLFRWSITDTLHQRLSPKL